MIDLPEVSVKWQALGLCFQTYDPRFFPERGKKFEILKLCKVCPVQVECLEYALATNPKHGIWGGKNKRERDRILKERKLGEEKTQDTD